MVGVRPEHQRVPSVGRPAGGLIFEEGHATVMQRSEASVVLRMAPCCASRCRRFAHGVVRVDRMTDVEVDGVSAVLAAVREVSAAQLAPAAAGVDRARQFPAENLRVLSEAGALGLLVPVSQGGVGGGLVALAEACEIVGGACASTGMVYLMHAVAAATVAGGGGARAGELLERMGTGAVVGTLAFSERGTGAHFYDPELAPSVVTAGLRVSGRKSFVTSGGHADVDAGAGAGPRAKGSIATRSSGMRRASSFDGAWEGLGMAGNSSIAHGARRCRGGRRRADRRAGRGSRPGVRRGGSDVPRRARGGQYRHRAGGAVRRRCGMPAARALPGRRPRSRSSRRSSTRWPIWTLRRARRGAVTRGGGARRRRRRGVRSSR